MLFILQRQLGALIRTCSYVGLREAVFIKDIHQYTQSLLSQAHDKVTFPYLLELRHRHATPFH